MKVLALLLFLLPLTGHAADYWTEHCLGWTVHISRDLQDHLPRETARAFALVEQQLNGIIQLVPEPALGHLREVPIWISPTYPGERPHAEYHVSPGWLREHGRLPEMLNCVELTNVEIFAQEIDRMPVLLLHELAHAYHYRVLGVDHPGIRTAWEHARLSTNYDAVERWNGSGRPRTVERAYALTNPQEYFAESTEAFFARNDFAPFTREELARRDPEMCALLARLWGVAP